MKKVSIFCAGGLSSSLIAKEAAKLFQTESKDIAVDATSVTLGQKMIEAGEYDLYLVSPQVRMYYDRLAKIAGRMDRKIDQIPAQAYVPLPKQTRMLTDLIETHI